MNRHTADSIADDALEQLYAERSYLAAIAAFTFREPIAVVLEEAHQAAMEIRRTTHPAPSEETS